MKKVEDINRYGYVLKERNPDVIFDSISTNISKVQTELIANRLKDEEFDYYKEDITKYFYNHFDLLRDIDKLSDIEKASSLIEKHLNKNNHIVCVTDYDLDGITSATVLYRSLTEVFNVPKYKVSVIVNKRKDGNGFNKRLLERIYELNNKKKIDLIISADHGSSDEYSFKEIKSKIKCDMVITDHHQIPYNNYPNTPDVFINPQRKDSTYCKEISGCFTAYLVMLNTYKVMYNPKNYDKFNSILPYVAISTIGDVMSLKYTINRYIVKVGLNELNSFRNKAWLAIKKIVGIPGKITSKDIGFKLGPLINTANRVDNEDLAFKLLILNDFETAMRIGNELSKLNTFRKNVTKSVLKEVNKKISNNEHKDSIVTTIETNLAINGVVAANIGTANNLPTVCFIDNSDNKEILVGSCRAIVKGFNLINVFNGIKNEDDSVLVSFGGHEGAAGCSVRNNKLEKFKTLFNKYSKQQLDNLDMSKEIKIDSIIPDFLITAPLAKSIEACGPYGKDWEEPVFLSRLKVLNVFVMGTMAKLTLKRRNGTTLQATHFFNNSTDITVNNIKEVLTPGTEIFLAYNINIDSYLESYDMMITVVDISIIKDEE